MPNKRILLVEDNEGDRFAIKRMFKKKSLPYDLSIAVNVTKAIDQINAQEFDLVLVDHGLPDGTGLDVQKAAGDIPCIYITGATNVAVAIEAMKAGAVDFLVKDFEQSFLEFLPLSITSALQHKLNVEKRLQAETALKESEEKFSKAFLNLPDAITISTLAEEKIIEINEGFERIFGFSRKEAIGKTTVELNIWKNIEERNNFTAILKRKEVVRDMEAELGSKSGEVYSCLLSADIINLHGTPHLLTIVKNISHQKNTENELKLAKQEAEKANIAKSEFLANISHEIRTPMNAILGFSELLSKKNSDPTINDYLETIRTSGNTLLSLINDILDLSKIEAGKMSIQYDYINIRLMLTEVKDMFKLRAKEKDIEFILYLDPHMPEQVYIDEIRVRQVLINLVGNAVKFTHKGYIKLTVHPENLRSEISHGKQKEYIDMVVEVEDTGIGIPKDIQKKIFEPFTSGKESITKEYGGTGLGLAISRKLLDLMNGEISLKSEPGKRTIFTVVFKKILISHEKIKTVEEESKQYSEIRFKGAKVIIVDDVDSNRRLLISALKDYNLDLYEASDGAQALRMAHAVSPDLIITDIRMPVMSGYKLLEEIRKTEKLAKIPVIAATASVMEESLKKIKGYNFNGFLKKPFKLNDLFITLSQFLPYETIEKPSEAIIEPTEGKEYHVHAETIDKLVNEYMIAWKQLQDLPDMEEVMSFAITIKTLGDNEQVQILSDYGEMLISAVNNFNIEKIIQTLQEYPSLVDTIKKSF
ncbi:MAG: response regulator [Bacteroidales bacterium]|nr:response regulator [Bacteroidales bacterium]